MLAAFILWLAVNDRLQTYTAVLWGNTAAPKPSGTVTGSQTGDNIVGGIISGSGKVLAGASALGL